MLAAVAVLAYATYRFYTSDTKKEEVEDDFVVIDEDPEILRSKAAKEAELRNACFAAATKAYKKGNKKEAAELSSQGKKHDAKVKSYNRNACELIFAANNKKYKGTLHMVDLHGLHVKEALKKAEEHLVAAKNAKLKQTHIITGKGNNSPNQIAKIKPAIEQFLTQQSMKATLLDGSILVDLDVPKEEAGWFDAVPCCIM
eukprot:Phypoly_transcript_16511.p1 GENE.Phypoly_transcript_16511~~Phypoly_transcript_16511.p1  ORF type:complete len:200 (+),score=51.61 Phypoly_transcript_16511:156-755(+)